MAHTREKGKRRQRETLGEEAEHKTFHTGLWTPAPGLLGSCDPRNMGNEWRKLHHITTGSRGLPLIPPSKGRIHAWEPGIGVRWSEKAPREGQWGPGWTTPLQAQAHQAS